MIKESGLVDLGGWRDLEHFAWRLGEEGLIWELYDMFLVDDSLWGGR